MQPHLFRAVPLPHCEDVLSAEIRDLGAAVSSSSPKGVDFQADLETCYRILIENRSASRLIFPVGSYTITGGDDLYSGARAIAWEEHLNSGTSFKIDSGIRTRLFQHSNFPVLKVKDAIVDRLRDRFGVRPDIDAENPDVTVNMRLIKDTVELSIDLGGGSLHRRGYRVAGVEAPLKENLAAAILMRASWPQTAREGGGFYDPFCGSGTFCIEAALMSAGIAPGILRVEHPVVRWPGHRSDIWEPLLAEYGERAREGRARLAGGRHNIAGSDTDPRAVAAARRNAAAAGLEAVIDFSVLPVREAVPPAGKPGLVATNPPYGERLGTGPQAELVYCDLGLSLRRSFAGWRLAFLTPEKELGLATGIKADKSHALSNGSIPVSLIHASIEEYRISDGTEMFINRLRKNRRGLRSYLKSRGPGVYRLYDKDMPEYAFAVDLYDETWCNLQEYAAPSGIDPRSVRRRRREAFEGLIQFLEIGSEAIFVKERRRLGSSDRYQRRNDEREKCVCREGDLRFFVNFTDYLDTGLFPDSRELRRIIRDEVSGKAFLNLFAYTCTATVAAAAGEATSSLSVDASKSYLDWGRDNMRLNKLNDGNHRFITADTMEFLGRAAASGERFDFAYVDPPTYSNSKDRKRDFDIQRDHRELIEKTARLIRPGGTILFCTNFTKFEPDPLLESRFGIREITDTTIPPDFARRSRIHRAFRIDL